jgi:hypothetical protein
MMAANDQLRQIHRNIQVGPRVAIVLEYVVLQAFKKLLFVSVQPDHGICRGNDSALMPVGSVEGFGDLEALNELAIELNQARAAGQTALLCDYLPKTDMFLQKFLEGPWRQLSLSAAAIFHQNNRLAALVTGWVRSDICRLALDG